MSWSIQIWDKSIHRQNWVKLQSYTFQRIQKHKLRQDELWSCLSRPNTKICQSKLLQVRNLLFKDFNKTEYFYDSKIVDIRFFWHCVWVCQPANADCMISIEYYSSIIRSNSITFQNIWESVHGENIPIIIQIEKANLSLYFREHFLTRDLVTSNNTIDITQSASADCRTHTECRNMESLLLIEYELFIAFSKFIPKPSFLKLWNRSAIKPAIQELKSFEIHNAVKTTLTWRFTFSGDPLRMFLIMKTASIWNASMHPFIRVNDPSSSLQFLLRKIDLISSQKIFKSKENVFIFEGGFERRSSRLSKSDASKIEEALRETWMLLFRSATVGGVSGSWR